MTWNYRAIRKTNEFGTYYDIHEVHYKGDEIQGWTEDAIDPNGMESIDEMLATLSQMLADVRRHLPLEFDSAKGKLVPIVPNPPMETPTASTTDAEGGERGKR